MSLNSFFSHIYCHSLAPQIWIFKNVIHIIIKSIYIHSYSLSLAMDTRIYGSTRVTNRQTPAVSKMDVRRKAVIVCRKNTSYSATAHAQTPYIPYQNDPPSCRDYQVNVAPKCQSSREFLNTRVNIQIYPSSKHADVLRCVSKRLNNINYH